MSDPFKLQNVKDINDLKERAYKTAVYMFNNKHDFKWLNSIINRAYNDTEYFSYDVDTFVDMVKVYLKYITGSISKEEGKKRIDEIIQKHNEDDKEIGTVIDKMSKFMMAIDNAFKTRNLKYGEITFTCPLCQGEAFASRGPLPENPEEIVNHYAGCKGCGMTMMV